VSEDIVDAVERRINLVYDGDCSDMDLFAGLLAEVKRLRASTIRAQVSEFHRVYEQPIGDKPAVPDEKTVRLRASLIAEEFVEMLEAMFGPFAYNRYGVVTATIDDLKHRIGTIIDLSPIKVDLPELADAWGDLDYVVEGSRLAFGVNGEPIAAEIQRSNLSKLGADGKPVRREDGKVLKGPNFTRPDIAGELRKQGWVG
jgi:predicted HAD superfamily Cof-like phosphohydrolase